MIGNPPRRSGSGREAHKEVREWTAGPIGGSGLPSGGSGVVGRPSLSSRSDREVLLEGRDAFPEFREWSGGTLIGSALPSGGLGVVGRPSWRSGSCREALPEVRVW